MAKHQHVASLLLLLMAVAVTTAPPSAAFLVQPQPNLLTYHNGAVLSGDIPVSILWYGRFTPAQKAVVSDFLLSLSAACAVLADGRRLGEVEPVDAAPPLRDGRGVGRRRTAHAAAPPPGTRGWSWPGRSRTRRARWGRA